MSGKTCCGLQFKDLGEKYMENARSRTLHDPWDSFLFGLGLTMTRNAKRDSVSVLQGLKDEWPTIEKARWKCSSAVTIVKPYSEHLGGIKPYAPKALEATYGPTAVTRSVCLNSAAQPTQIGFDEEDKPEKKRKYNPSWGVLEQTLETLATKSLDPDDARKQIRHHFTFRGQKGADMLQLEAGAEIPVMDRWMIKKVLRLEKDPKWKGVNPNDDKSAKGIRFQAEVDRIQHNQSEFLKKRQVIIDEAKSCKTPVGVYHVACWFSMVFGDDRKAAEAYLDKLIAITEEGK